MIDSIMQNFSDASMVAASQQINLVDCIPVEKAISDVSEIYSPGAGLINYFANTKGILVNTSKSKVIILTYPKNGYLKYIGVNEDYGDTYRYIANPNFFGNDYVVALVEFGNKKYKISTTFYVLTKYKGGCEIIKKSSILDLDTSKLLVNSSALAPQTLGLTTDNGDGSKTITLDDNGAGYGWYSTGADVASMLSDWSSQMASVCRDSPVEK